MRLMPIQKRDPASPILTKNGTTHACPPPDRRRESGALKSILSTACVLLSVATLADTPNVQPSADTLLKRVIEQLPAAPIRVSGELLVRKRRGIPVNTYAFEFEAHWGHTPPRARYRIRDAFGNDLEQLTIIHGVSPTYYYAAGNPLREAPPPQLTQSIQQTDLTWMDLTLAFLWWPDSTIVGEDTFRNFDCTVVDVHAPICPSQAEGEVGSRRPSELPSSLQPRDPTSLEAPSYAFVRLWIAQKAPLLLQAEAYNEENECIRRFWVRSCKKIDDEWMIKEMEIQRFPAIHRTKLRVQTVISSENSGLMQTNTQSAFR